MWTVDIVRAANPVQTNYKGADDVITLRRRDFEKTF